jgi:transglutaminase-like putative cysteine protease
MKKIKIFLFLVLFLMVGSALTACSTNAPESHPSTAISSTVTMQASVEETTNSIPPTVEASATLLPTEEPTSVPAPTSTIPPTPEATPVPAQPLSYANPQQYSVTYSVVIANSGFSPSDIRLYLPMPSEYDAQKNISIDEISPEPKSKSAEKNSGNSMLYWQPKGAPKKNEAATFTLRFSLTAFETNTNIDPAAVQPYAPNSPEVRLYTKSEKFIESKNPKITALANSLVGSETNPYLQAKLFYDYIIDHTQYRLIGQGLNGAMYLLDHGNGECGDYSALFIALSRAKGIPARPVVGYWAISGNEQTHVWAEFYIEGIGWIPVDATIGQQSATKRTYYFGNMDNQRVILSKGFNTPLVPVGPSNFVAPILQTPLWWFWGSGNADTLKMERSWMVSKSN